MTQYPATQHPAAEQIFVGDSEMAQLMRSLDWSQTPLGEPVGWSQSLRTVLSILLTSQHPIFLWWGKELIQFYNDAYRPILGTTKHPQAMGQPGRECWQEIWPVIEPMIDAVMQHGEATRIRDGLLMLERNGYLEECYFNYAYSPVRDETGEVGGVFCTCDETTKRVLGERQLKTLRELAAQPLQTRTVEEACQLCMGAIAKNPADLPFALLYLMDETGESAQLMGTAGIEPGTIASPKQILIATQDWNLIQVKLSEQSEILMDLATRFASLPPSLWDVPPQSAMVVPLNQSGQQQIAGFLILAVSPRRAFDDEYRGFFEVVASQVETAIANARAYEEERKRVELLAELDRAKTAFFSNVSHEFRTPLTLMLSPLEETLANLEGIIPTQEREQLQLVQRNGKRLLKLVNSLLDFSRIEAGRVQVSYEPVDLSTYTAELASAFHSLIDQAGLSFVIECPPLPEAVYVDRDMWEKIVLNLLSNAFKFTLSGTISVRLRRIGSQIELSVTDTGVGIPPDELPHLFERFHRVENAQGRSYEGSGIGLSLVQELVKLQGGTIQVASTLGQGSCFTVLIPAKLASLPKEKIAASRPLATTTSASTALDAMPYVEEARRWLPERNLELPIVDFEPEGRRSLAAPNLVDSTDPSNSQDPKSEILLADDNVDMRHYIQRLLNGSYTVRTATDGLAALEEIQSNRPDLVLTDAMMPRMDGFELLRALRSDPATQDIPIILLSARAGEESCIEGLQAGADDYLIKPFSARELMARVEATLKLAQLRRAAREREQALQLETQIARAKLDQIMSNLRDGFATFDRDWRYTYINNRLLEILKLPREAVIGRRSWDVFPHQVGIEFFDLLNRAMNEQVEVQFEFYYGMVDSWVEHRVYPTAEGVAILMADVSGRKRAELLLVEQKRLLELTAAGEPMDNCLAAVCASVSNLSVGVRACILLTDAQRQNPRSIAPEFPMSFGRGLQNAPIDALAIGTCGTAADGGQPVACEDIVCEDIVNDERWTQEWRDLCLTHGIRACYSAPILNAEDLPLGSLMLCFDRPRMPTEWEYQLANFGTSVASIVFERDRSRLALQASESKYRTLFESMDEGFCICEMLFDENGAPTDYRFLEVNSVFGSLTGMEQATGKTVRALIPNLETDWFEIYGRVVQTGEPVRFENQSIAMNRWFDVNAFRIGDAHSNQFAVLFTNITDRKQTEIALQESEERLRVAQFGAKTGAWDWDLVTGNIIWSPEYYALFGIDPAIPPTYENWLTTVLEADRAAAEQAVRDTLDQQRTDLDFEFRSAHPIQGIRWFSCRGQIFYDSDAEPQRAIGIAIDINDRKRVEEALRQSEEKSRTILESITDAFIALDENWRYTYVNPTAEELLFRPPGYLVGKNIWEEYPGLIGSEFEQLCRRVAEKGVADSATLFYPDHRRWYEVRVYPVPNGITIYCSNVTERKQAETTLAERARELTRLNGLLAQSATLLEERNLELDRFVHIVSHDLKAPLRGIANLSQWIEEDIAESLSEDTRQQMDLLRNRVYRMEAMINGLLDYARAGRTDAMIETVDIADLLAEVIDSIAPPPTFQIEIASGMPTLLTKRLLLSQVFSNLISNGIKHHPRPDGSIRVSCQDLGDFYEFIVADDGSGIASEYHDKIFMIFQTVNPQKNADSSGVGLSIVKKIVETEEGKIRLESQVGKGTTFYFTWPKVSQIQN